jgi:hypothetical protein
VSYEKTFDNVEIGHPHALPKVLIFAPFIQALSRLSSVWKRLTPRDPPEMGSCRFHSYGLRFLSFHPFTPEPLTFLIESGLQKRDTRIRDEYHRAMTCRQVGCNAPGDIPQRLSTSTHHLVGSTRGPFQHSSILEEFNDVFPDSEFNPGAKPSGGSAFVRWEQSRMVTGHKRRYRWNGC